VTEYASAHRAGDEELGAHGSLVYDPANEALNATPRRKGISWAPVLWPIAVLGAFLAGWSAVASRTSALVLPAPLAVWTSFIQSLRDGTFIPAFTTTLEEALLGWAIGSLVALPLGYVLGRWTHLERGVSPYLAASQALPVIAIAPLLGSWLGYGLEPKVVVAALIVFFPVMTTTASGLRGVDRDLRDVARVFGASWFQTLIYLELPRSARAIFSGEKIGAALAVTGAFVAELLGANQGLYVLIQAGQTRFDFALVYVGVVALMVMGAGAYAIVSLAERLVLRCAE
jgi:NitT/TauT family transport system permease protein